MKTYEIVQTICVVLIALTLTRQPAAAQGTITIGTFGSKETHPFGILNGAAQYLGEYQQIYVSSAFTSPVLITQIAFANDNSAVQTANYTLSIGLGTTTTQTPDSPGTSFGGGITSVFSGSLSPTFTPLHDFDFPIIFTVPFFYDPSQGKLLLDVVVSAASSDPSSIIVFSISGTSGASDIGTLWSNSGSIVSTPDYGLVTQFTVQAVPEPSELSLAALGGGLAGVMCLRQRRRG
jgi:hypothetical protein